MKILNFIFIVLINERELKTVTEQTGNFGLLILILHHVDMADSEKMQLILDLPYS
jgi:hypothetical protein